MLKLPYRELDGIPGDLLEAHYGLYQGYVERIGGVRKRLREALEKPGIW